MSEKAMVIIDRGLIIPGNSEKIFENQYVRLEAGIECKGTLIFRNCTIEPCATLESKNGRKPACKPGCISMGIDGKLEMDGCEVIHPGQDFLSSWDMVIKNTSFLINLCPDITEVSRLRKGTAGKYHTAKDHYYDCCSSIEALVTDEYHDVPYWTRTTVEHNGEDYYLVGYKGLSMNGLRVRVRSAA